MDARNYSITNLDKKRRRINPDSKSNDLNEIDVDFDIELKNGSDDFPRYINVSKCIKDNFNLNKEQIVRVDYATDKKDTVKVDDLVCESFANKSTFNFIFSLNDFHKYKYEIKLNKNKALTFGLMYKIICQSAELVLKDTLEFLGTVNEKAKNKNEREKIKNELTSQMAKNSNQSGGFINFMKSILGGYSFFNINEKLLALEVEYVGVQENTGTLFVEFSGFEEDVDPNDTL